MLNAIRAENLISSALRGERVAISKLITLFERTDKMTFYKLMELFRDSSKDSHVIGGVIPPGDEAELLKAGFDAVFGPSS